MTDQQDLLDEIGVQPSLDYLHGYTVKTAAIVKNQLKIKFENGAILTDENENEEIPDTSALVGMSLQTTIYTTGKEGGPTTRILFSKWEGGRQVGDTIELTLVPGKYTIDDPRFKRQGRPQVEPLISPVADAEPEADPREVDGPTQEYLDSLEQEEADEIEAG